MDGRRFGRSMLVAVLIGLAGIGLFGGRDVWDVVAYRREVVWSGEKRLEFKVPRFWEDSNPDRICISEEGVMAFYRHKGNVASTEYCPGGTVRSQMYWLKKDKSSLNYYLHKSPPWPYPLPLTKEMVRNKMDSWRGDVAERKALRD